MKIISSKNNPDIKTVLQLKKKRNRDKAGLYLVEGQKELELAQSTGQNIKVLNFCPKYKDAEISPELAKINNINILSPEVFANVSYRENPDGYLGLVEQKHVELEDIKLNDKPFIIVLQNVEKPGNLGAILRTADASGADAVILNDQQTDIYNPNVIRASIGAIFTVPVVHSDKKNTQEFLANNNIKTVATSPRASKDYTKIKYKQGIAVLIGEEHSGLDDFWLKKANYQVSIPMLGRIDSLNASVSTAILAYEILKQRRD